MEVQGRAFAEDEDWAAYLRDVIARPDGHPEVGKVGLAGIEAAAKGTPQAARIADAALGIVERGGVAELESVQELGVHEAPEAAARLRVLLAREEWPSEARAWLACELLAIVREDPVARGVLREALAGPGDHRRALLGAARHLPEWPGALLGHAITDEQLLLELWKATPVPRRRAFIDAVVAAGPESLDALIAGARQHTRTGRDQAPLMMMLAPHLPDPTSGEIVVETMVGTLRANRKDPRQAELAERVLHDHEMWRKKPGEGD